MKESGDVLNWFEITVPEGYFSINDKIGEILAHPKASRCMKWILLGLVLKHGKKLLGTGGKKGGGKVGLANPDIMKMIGGFTVKRAVSMVGTMGTGLKFEKAEVLKINRKLNRIRK